MRIAPSVTGAKPQIARRMVDLPDPDSPTSPKDSRGATEKETSRTAWTHRLPCSKVTDSRSISISATDSLRPARVAFENREGRAGAADAGQAVQEPAV
jgi:hypothetical protein